MEVSVHLTILNIPKTRHGVYFWLNELKGNELCRFPSNKMGKYTLNVNIKTECHLFQIPI